MRCSRRLIVLVSFLAHATAACAGASPHPAASPAPPHAAAAAPRPEAPLADGLYAVLDEAPSAEGLARVGGAIRRVPAGDSADPPRYVALDISSGPAAHVPLVLAAPPKAEVDGAGRTLLGVTLASEHVATLAAFTRAHVGGRSAVVVGDEVVTVHKVRQVIEDGRLKITRCDDDRCTVLYSKLTGPKS